MKAASIFRDYKNASGCACGEYGKEENYQVRNIYLNDVFLQHTEGTLDLYLYWAVEISPGIHDSQTHRVDNC